MRVINQLRVIYYTIVLWVEDLFSRTKITRGSKALVTREQTRQNHKLARGVKHLTKWMRSLSPTERERLIKEDVNILMQAGRSRELSVTEKLEQARAAAKLVNGPAKETEEAMAETFVKNQAKYKLLARRRQIHKDWKDGKMDSRQARRELDNVRLELKKYE